MEVIAGTVIILLTTLLVIPFLNCLDQLHNPPSNDAVVVDTVIFLLTMGGMILGMGLGLWLIRKPRGNYF